MSLALVEPPAAEGVAGPGLAAPVPFEEILTPLARQAMDEVARRLALGSALDRFGGRARAALARSLLQQLVGAAAPTLLAAFDLRRPQGPQLLARLLEGEARIAPADGGSRERYAAFVDEMAQGGLARLLEDHPVLGRLLASLAADFADRTVELAERLAADLPALAGALGWRGDPGQVTGLRPALSDPHRHGAAVAMLAFASGDEVVYKPRSLALDAAFCAFHRLCDDHAPAPAFLLRPDWGWMQVVRPAPPAGRQVERALAASTGRLLAALYALGVCDCHFENLIADGEKLALVDAEAALQPQPPFMDAQKLGLGDPWPWDSVSRPGLLPGWTFSPDGASAWVLSALGAWGERRGAFQAPRWRAVNTDEMTLASEPAPLDTLAPPAEIDVEALVGGFEAAYRRLAARKAALLASDAFAEFGRARTRVVFRSTRLYVDLLAASLAPEALRSADAHRCVLDQLPLLTDDPDPAWAAVRAAEVSALARLDVPHFTIATDRDELESGDGPPIRLQGVASGLADARARLARLGEADLARQVAIIRGTFAAIRTRTGRTSATAPPAAAPAAIGRALGPALELADELARTALRDSGGAASWLDLRYHERADCYSLQRAGLGLYDGAAGIGLFLAAAAALTERRDLAELALAALAPIRALADPLGDPHARLAGVGAATGVGSLVYGLVRAADFLAEPALLSDAARLARAIDTAPAAPELAGDALAGDAGAAIALLALHARTGEAAPLAAAVAAGRRALAAPPRLTGMAHGAAGLALALFRLAQASGDDAFRRAGAEALAFERAHFDPRAGGWRDLRTHSHGGHDGETRSTMWCHGAPGIGLCRLALLDTAADGALEAEIEAAIAATLAYGAGGADHLCCGAFGRVDFLTEAGAKLGRPELLAAAQGLAQQRLARRGEVGELALSWDDGPQWLKPSLFRGVAGVGYALLRLAAPHDVPTVLTWG